MKKYMVLAIISLFLISGLNAEEKGFLFKLQKEAGLASGFMNVGSDFAENAERLSIGSLDQIKDQDAKKIEAYVDRLQKENRLDKEITILESRLGDGKNEKMGLMLTLTSIYGRKGLIEREYGMIRKIEKKQIENPKLAFNMVQIYGRKTYVENFMSMEGMGIKSIEDAKKLAEKCLKYITTKEEAVKWIDKAESALEFGFMELLLNGCKNKNLLDADYYEAKMKVVESHRLGKSREQDELRKKLETEKRIKAEEDERIKAESRPVKDEKKSQGNMIFISAGTFQMGDPFGSGHNDEKPMVKATVADFYIGRYEVTQKEWKEVAGNNPSSFKGDNLPVENVTWYDCIEYCNKRSQKEGLTPVYTIDKKNIDKANISENDDMRWVIFMDAKADGYRLPFENEWEYAAKGGQSAKKTKYSGGDTLADIAWFGDNSGKKTYPVGQKLGNELGLFDMNGNVSEWCWDWYDRYKGNRDTDARYGKKFRVVRGGSFGSGENYSRTSERDFWRPAGKDNFLGFRVARSSN